MCIFLYKVQVMQVMRCIKVHQGASRCNRSVILIDRLDPVVLSALRIKGQVLHRLRAHLKVRG